MGYLKRKTPKSPDKSNGTVPGRFVGGTPNFYNSTTEKYTERQASVVHRSEETAVKLSGNL